MSNRTALLRLLAGVVLISFSAVFVKLVSVPPTTSGLYRCLFGGLILLVLVRLRGESLVTRRGPFLMLLGAALFFALDLWVWHRSILYVGPGLATLLGNFQVFILALAGVVLFGERLRWPVVLSIPLALLGLSLIVGFDWSALGPEYRLGIAFGLMTAVFYAAYLLSLRRARGTAGAGTASADLAVVSLATAALLAVAAPAGGESLAIPSWRDAAILLAYGIVAQVLGWVLISGSLPQIAASRVGLILLLQPLLAFVWDVLFFSRRISVLEAAGAAIALVAIYLGSRRGAVA